MEIVLSFLFVLVLLAMIVQDIKTKLVSDFYSFLLLSIVLFSSHTKEYFFEALSAITLSIGGIYLCVKFIDWLNSLTQDSGETLLGEADIILMGSITPLFEPAFYLIFLLSCMTLKLIYLAILNRLDLSTLPFIPAICVSFTFVFAVEKTILP